MHLLLWRHAEAEDGEEDMQRRLTLRGQKQARMMAAWIRSHAPGQTRILVSPAVRTRETAAALDLPFSIDERLAPDAGPDDLLAACGWPGADAEVGESVLIVGHQPTLGQAAARLMTGQDAPWTIRKGGLWWLSRRTRRHRSETVLRSVLGPDLL